MERKRYKNTIKAIEALENGHSVRRAAAMAGVDRKTLEHYYGIYQKAGIEAGIEAVSQAMSRARSYSITFKENVAASVVEDGRQYTDAAKQFGVPEKTVRRWAKLYKDNGLYGLDDKRKHRTDKRTQQQSTDKQEER